MGNRIRAILVSQDGDHYPFTSKLAFDCINNMTEYETCIMGIRAAIKRKIKVLEVYGDSALVIYQLKGEWETRDPKLIDYRKLDILRYVKNREYPEQATKNDKRTLRRLANKYVLDGEILYKGRKDQMLPRQIMRFGYYWSTMEGDCINYAKRCHKCQIYGDKIHPLYGNVTKSKVSKFLKKEIICRYGMLERIISDNALNLNNSTIVEVCSQFKIKHNNSSPYLQKMNGAVEATNKNIKNIVGKMTETYKDWHEKLPFALYAYRMSVKTSTRVTPFSLVYGMDTALPIEVEIHSL
ncbi:RNA-directed DNA polymerase (Reverse transcriptase) [Gossypium australe]|uniref:RNA-directed DNA polymerase (Reverse transcriptase) n=1 Tax=Gossypium australe TaxID=47621 RepID=A0A5B6WNP4_9ROSI|nr:RNA-directed DNA polymerase (Reverse transcriptase) [Gossypium australe]